MRRLGLRDSRLDATRWSRVEAVGCDLDSVDLSRSSLDNLRALGCDLRRARAPESTWRNVNLLDCELTSGDWSGARLHDFSVEGGDGSWLCLERALCIRASFRHPRLGGYPFMRSRLAGAFFLDCDLRHANFYAAELRGAVLIRCDLSDAHFDEVDLGTTVFIDCITDRTCPPIYGRRET